MAAANTSNEKIQEALALLNDAAKDKKDELKGAMSEKYVHLKDVLGEVESEVAGTVRHGREKAYAAKDIAESKARDVASSVDERVHEDPWKIMGYVAGGALIMGYLLGRKD